MPDILELISSIRRSYWAKHQEMDAEQMVSGMEALLAPAYEYMEKNEDKVEGAEFWQTLHRILCEIKEKV